MGVRVVSTFKPLADLPLSTKAVMREVGLLARERVLKRTLAGRDEDDAPFTPYSSAYRAVKTKELGSATPVNLQVSGRMLNAIVITELTERSVTLGFSS